LPHHHLHRRPLCRRFRLWPRLGEGIATGCRWFILLASGKKQEQENADKQVFHEISDF